MPGRRMGVEWMRRKKNAVKGMTVKISIKRGAHCDLHDVGKVIDDMVEMVGKFSPYVEVSIEA